MEEGERWGWGWDCRVALWGGRREVELWEGMRQVGDMYEWMDGYSKEGVGSGDFVL